MQAGICGDRLPVNENGKVLCTPVAQRQQAKSKPVTSRLASTHVILQGTKNGGLQIRDFACQEEPLELPQNAYHCLSSLSMRSFRAVKGLISFYLLLFCHVL